MMMKRTQMRVTGPTKRKGEQREHGGRLAQWRNGLDDPNSNEMAGSELGDGHDNHGSSSGKSGEPSPPPAPPTTASNCSPDRPWVLMVS